MHCVRWLQDAHPFLLAFHVANERKGAIGAGVHFQRMGVLAGVADLLLFYGGRCLAIELKDTKGKQSDEQKNFEHRWRNAGSDYYVVRTVERFQAVVNNFAIGTKLPWG